MVLNAIVQAQSDAEYAAGRALFEDYARFLGVDLGFQGFTSEVQHLPSIYGPPGGCLLLARRDAAFIGCVGVRRWSAGSCEMKRLYVQQAARGTGTGAALVLAAIERAKAMGYRRMLLDTLPDMNAAHRLYAVLGFQPCAPYRHNPVAGTTFMALDLAAT
jgi:carbonic anhydrase